MCSPLRLSTMICLQDCDIDLICFRREIEFTQTVESLPGPHPCTTNAHYPLHLKDGAECSDTWSSPGGTIVISCISALQLIISPPTPARDIRGDVIALHRTFLAPSVDVSLRWVRQDMSPFRASCCRNLSSTHKRRQQK